MAFGATTLLAIALGGALGSLARVIVAEAVTRRLGAAFPYGTLVVNVTGAAAIGGLAPFLLGAGIAADHGLAAAMLIVGVLGSYTTVSSFSLQTLALMRERAWRRVTANILGSVLLCLAAASVAGLLVTLLRGG
jgi:CrcB protein